jgi:adenine deaminase
MAAGVDSDHTKNPVPVALEKARMGMLLQIQEKSISRELIEGLLAMPLRPPFCLVTDDVAPDKILREGHLDHVGRMAVAAGLPPLEALRAISLTPAQRLRLNDRGVVSPGKRADLVLLDDIASFTPRLVIAGGRIVARDGRPTTVVSGNARPSFQDSVKVTHRTAADFVWHVERPDGPVTVRAIRVNGRDTSTQFDELTLSVSGGSIRWQDHAPLLTIWERHGHTGAHAQAPVTGLRLGRDGAIASTYAHDSHNLLVLGTSSSAMAAAANAVIDAGGGIAVARGEHIRALLPLPIGGIMSAEPAQTIVDRSAAVREAMEEWGYRHANPFMSMACLSLPVSPQLKLTDQGLVDVDRRMWAEPILG